VVATANDISSLPPELLRKGRLDEIFFVDLPNNQERREIFAIHLALKGRDYTSFAIDDFADAAEGFSGGEIAEVINSALYDAFYESQALNNDHILQAIRSTVPLSRTMEEHLTRLRAWAEGRARPASA
jgi:SpoVK/Ycf46/Vps4 family AAA+-type ATPase